MDPYSIESVLDGVWVSLNMAHRCYFIEGAYLGLNVPTNRARGVRGSAISQGLCYRGKGQEGYG